MNYFLWFALISLSFAQLKVGDKAPTISLFRLDNNKYYHCPAFAAKIVDKIGAGDALLALLSCSLKSGFDADLCLLIGSLAAAQSVESIGNSIPVSKGQLLKTLHHAIK